MWVNDIKAIWSIIWYRWNERDKGTTIDWGWVWAKEKWKTKAEGGEEYKWIKWENK